MDILNVARQLRVFSQELVAYKLGTEFADAVSVAATILEQSEGVLRAKEEDRLIVLPAKKVHEIVWVPGPECDDVCPVIIDGEPQCNMCETGRLAVREVECRQEHLDYIGETVFLTEQEAVDMMKVIAEESFEWND